MERPDPPTCPTCVSLDMYIGVTGWICDESRGLSLQQAVKHVPLDRVMLETDAPYLLPKNLNIKPVKKNRNEHCCPVNIAGIRLKSPGHQD